MIAPYYEEPGIAKYNADCRDVLPQLEPVDLVLTDPPYGIGWDTRHSRFTSGFSSGKRKNYAPLRGDNDLNSLYLLFGNWELIWWGAHLRPWEIRQQGSWLVWDKRFDSGAAMLGDAELAWWSTGKSVYIFKHTWQGMIGDKTGIPRARNHPTEKPVELMRWCIQKAMAAGTILDPFMGSGTTLVAAKELGRKAIGIEIEEKYCEIAVKRLRQEVLAL